MAVLTTWPRCLDILPNDGKVGRKREGIRDEVRRLTLLVGRMYADDRRVPCRKGNVIVGAAVGCGSADENTACSCMINGFGNGHLDCGQPNDILMMSTFHWSVAYIMAYGQLSK